MNLRSHSLVEIKNREKGIKVFALDTKNAGEDDTLLGETREEVLQDVLDYHGLDGLPQGWSLREVPECELESFLQTNIEDVHCKIQETLASSYWVEVQTEESGICRIDKEENGKVTFSAEGATWEPRKFDSIEELLEKEGYDFLEVISCG